MAQTISRIDKKAAWFNELGKMVIAKRAASPTDFDLWPAMI
jgi:hypothetical protein